MDSFLEMKGYETAYAAPRWFGAAEVGVQGVPSLGAGFQAAGPVRRVVGGVPWG